MQQKNIEYQHDRNRLYPFVKIPFKIALITDSTMLKSNAQINPETLTPVTK